MRCCASRPALATRTRALPRTTTTISLFLQLDISLGLCSNLTLCAALTFCVWQAQISRLRLVNLHLLSVSRPLRSRPSLLHDLLYPDGHPCHCHGTTSQPLSKATTYEPSARRLPRSRILRRQAVCTQPLEGLEVTWRITILTRMTCIVSAWCVSLLLYSYDRSPVHVARQALSITVTPRMCFAQSMTWTESSSGTLNIILSGRLIHSTSGEEYPGLGPQVARGGRESSSGHAQIPSRTDPIQDRGPLLATPFSGHVKTVSACTIAR